MGSRLIHYEVRAFPGAVAVGRTATVPLEIPDDDHTIEDLWDSMAADGSLDVLTRLAGQFGQPGDTAGWMGDWNPGEPTFTYLAGVLLVAGSPVPPGFEHRDVAPCQMAVAQLLEIDGDEGGNLHGAASDNLGRASREHGYEYDGSTGMYEIEYQTLERFHQPLSQGQPVTLDFMSPCKQTDPTS